MKAYMIPTKAREREEAETDNKEWPAQPQAASISGFGFAFLIWAALPWEWICKHYAFCNPYRDKRGASSPINFWLISALWSAPSSVWQRQYPRCNGQARGQCLLLLLLRSLALQRTLTGHGLSTSRHTWMLASKYQMAGQQLSGGEYVLILLYSLFKRLIMKVF